MKNSARLMFLLAWSPGILLFFVWFHSPHVAVLRCMNRNCPQVWDINSLRVGDLIWMVHLFNMLLYYLLMVNGLCDNLLCRQGSAPLPYKRISTQYEIDRPITTFYLIWGGINTMTVHRGGIFNNDQEGCRWCRTWLLILLSRQYSTSWTVYFL